MLCLTSVEYKPFSLAEGYTKGKRRAADRAVRGDQTLEVEKELKHIRALEAVLRSEDERNTRLIAEHERQKATRMEQAMAMFGRVQSAKLKRQNTI